VTLANELPTISQRPGPLRPIAAVKAPRSLMVAALVFIAQCAGFFTLLATCRRIQIFPPEAWHLVSGHDNLAAGLAAIECGAAV